MVKIAKEEEQWVYSAFEKAVNEEKRWANYLFKDGSMIGLNEKLLHNYVEWIANRRMKSIGLKPVYDVPANNNPLPWVDNSLTESYSEIYDHRKAEDLFDNLRFIDYMQDEDIQEVVESLVWEFRDYGNTLAESFDMLSFAASDTVICESYDQVS
jgi:hypothetical protein